MASSISLSLCWIWLSGSVLRSAASEGQEIITAESGENVTVTCRAPISNNIIVVEWSRADLKEEYVLMYRDGHFDPTNQHPSFKNRVDLQDRYMKDGNVSLILKDVTINDAGTYECRVFMSGTKNGANRRKRAFLKTPPISITSLSVVDHPGHTGGDTVDGGGKIVEPAAILSVSAVLLLLAFVVGFVSYRKCKPQQSQKLYQPPAEHPPV